VVFGAGNEPVDARFYYPHNARSVVTVGAHASNDVRANWSAGGFAVDVYAPGVDILSLIPNNRYRRTDGTSMASPHVAGLAALARAVKRSWTPDDFTVALRATSRDANYQRYPGLDKRLSYGIADAQRLLAFSPSVKAARDDRSEVITVRRSGSFWVSVYAYGSALQDYQLFVNNGVNEAWSPVTGLIANNQVLPSGVLAKLDPRTFSDAAFLRLVARDTRGRTYEDIRTLRVEKDGWTGFLDNPFGYNSCWHAGPVSEDYVTCYGGSDLLRIQSLKTGNISPLTSSRIWAKGARFDHRGVLYLIRPIRQEGTEEAVDELLAHDPATQKTVPLLRFKYPVSLESVSADYVALSRYVTTTPLPLAVRLSDLKILEPTRDCVVPEACDALEPPILVGSKLLWRTAMKDQTLFREFRNSRLAYIDLSEWQHPPVGRGLKASFITPELGSFSEEGVVTDGRNIVFDSKGQEWQSKMVHYSFETKTKTDVPVSVVRKTGDGSFVLGKSKKAVFGKKVVYIQTYGDAGEEISVVDISTGVNRQITNDAFLKRSPFIFGGKLGWFDSLPNGFSYVVPE
jgi:hypothetical protein